jgi:glycosyltransferase involved in cell wall biosynthesis
LSANRQSPARESDITAVMTAMTDGERPWTQEALSSILTQTVLPDIVVLLVEQNNSWIEADMADSPHRSIAERLVQIHRIPMARLGAVRNAGVQRARTKWVAYLDGDDIWRPQRLERQLEAARDHPQASFVGGDYIFIDPTGRPFAFSNGSYPTPSSWLVERELMERHPFDPNAAMGEDYFWLKETKPVCVRIRVPEILVGYRIRGLSISAQHYGYSRQRRVREAMARASRFPFIRYPLLAASYFRYSINREHTYAM